MHTSRKRWRRGGGDAGRDGRRAAMRPFRKNKKKRRSLGCEALKAATVNVPEVPPASQCPTCGPNCSALINLPLDK